MDNRGMWREDGQTKCEQALVVLDWIQCVWLEQTWRKKPRQQHHQALPVNEQPEKQGRSLFLNFPVDSVNECASLDTRGNFTFLWGEGGGASFAFEKEPELFAVWWISTLNGRLIVSSRSHPAEIKSASLHESNTALHYRRQWPNIWTSTALLSARKKTCDTVCLASGWDSAFDCSTLSAVGVKEKRTNAFLLSNCAL